MTKESKSVQGWRQITGLGFREILYEKKGFEQGDVAKITINRPEKLNALTNEGMQEIVNAFDDAGHDQAVGAVIFTGAGDKAFCVGGDVKWEAKGLVDQMRRRVTSVNMAIRACRRPVIAEVKGWAIGSGNHWAYFCDFTIAAENAVFGQNGPRVGSPADGYLVNYLGRVVGHKRAREMWMLCRRYTAEEALHMGLVNKVVPLEKLDREVESWCEEILALSPTCIDIVKASFNAESDYAVYSHHYLGDLLYPNYLGSEEHNEANLAFQEKRKPDFGKFRGKVGRETHLQKEESSR